jgi:hypothetical protein
MYIDGSFTIYWFHSQKYRVIISELIRDLVDYGNLTLNELFICF